MTLYGFKWEEQQQINEHFMSNRRQRCIPASANCASSYFSYSLAPSADKLEKYTKDVLSLNHTFFILNALYSKSHTSSS